MMDTDNFDKKPREVLVIGNGFDVALGLPTQYGDFMDFLRIENPVEMIKGVQSGNEPEKKYEKFFRSDPASIDLDEIRRFVELKNHNAWARYYEQFNEEIKLWIDLEREMLPVLDLFRWIFAQKEEMISRDKRKQIITSSEEKYRIAHLLPKYFEVSVVASVGQQQQYAIIIRSEYCDRKYGIYKEKINDMLIKDLNEFIEMFRIYLRELVSNTKRIHHHIIEKLKADDIISFNYVQSELFLPNLKDAKAIHVHGDTTKCQNMVLGVNEVSNDSENEFLYFTKYFQRIKIKSNPHYRDLWNEPFNVTFFGHSLDVTDIDILKPLYEKAQHVTVYYYKEKDYEKKIINLLKLVGRVRVEEDNYSGRLKLLSSEE